MKRAEPSGPPVRQTGMRPLLIALMLTTLVITGCGSGSGSSTAEPATEHAPLMTRGATTVLDDGRPMLCFVVATSLPPQCSGPEIIGWDWDAVPVGSYEEANGVRWGGYQLYGDYVDGSFILDRAITFTDLAEQGDGAGPADEDEEDRLATRCPEPPGGWRPIDSATTTEGALNRTVRMARRLPGFSDVWLDGSRNPARLADFNDPDLTDDERMRLEESANDPGYFVINVLIVGDEAAVSAADAELRSVWGGALCVATTAHTKKELERWRKELHTLPDVVGSSVGLGGIDLDVLIDDGLSERLDATYGEGVVRVTSMLMPTAPGRG